MFIDDFTLDGKEEPPDCLLLSNHNEELKYLNAKKLLCCLRCCVKRKNKNRKTEAEEKLPTLPFEYHFALSMLGTKVKFHDLLRVLEPEKREFKTTCIVLLFYDNYDSWDRFQTKPLGIHTRFQTWSLGRHYVIIRLKCKQKIIQNFEFAYFSFLLTHLELKR